MTAQNFVRIFSSSASYFGFLYSLVGSSNNSFTGVNNTDEKWNGTSWATIASAANQYMLSSFAVNSLVHKLGGYEGTPSITSYNRTINSADAQSTSTNTPVSCDGVNGTNVGAGIGILCNSANATNSSVNCYTWNGTSWSSVITCTYGTYTAEGNGMGFSSSRNMTVRNGGPAISNGTAATSTETYNGVSFSSASSSINGRARGSSAVA
jgi:hypothetical protein